MDRGTIRQRGVAVLFGLVALLIVITHAFAPISIQPDAAFDDGLFLTLARRFANGNWFGTYYFLTLHKGNGYSIFLALGSWLGLPVSLAHGLFHAAACLTFAAVIRRVTGSTALGIAVLLALAMVPVLAMASGLRVLRDAIYSGQTLFLFAAVIWLLFRGRAPDMAGRGIGAGALLGWLWLTREEGLWVLPTLALLFLAFPLVRTGADGGARAPARLAATGLALVWFGLGFALVFGAYSGINRLAYGSWTTVAIKEASFERALGALYSVEDGDRVAYVPVSRATRMRIYAVSPAFAALKPYLDPPGAPLWVNGCPHYATGCDDMAGGWFHVAFLFAVKGLGQHETLEQAKAYYRRVADEVEAACTDGRLTCRRMLSNAVPRLAPDFVETLPRRIIGALRKVTMIDWGPVSGGPSTGTPVEIAEALTFLNRPPMVPTLEQMQKVVLEAQFIGPDATPLVMRLVDAAGAAIPATLEPLPPPPGRPGPPPPGEQLLRITATCPLAACWIDVTQKDRQITRLRLWDLMSAGSRVRTPEGSFRISKMLVDGAGTLGDVRYRTSQMIRSGLAAAMPFVLPPLAAIGVLACLVGLVLAALARRLPFSLLIALSLGLGVVTRLTILILGDAAGLPIADAYVMPACFLTAVSAPLALYGCWSAARALKARRAGVI
ncbi:hypothetical protein GCM10007301_09030 [Azorhizobium oxalatiphilum]|uniref:Uncharacterized protein n=2 Tax=Azorhizobium oxalatiphilum TaxID=980631 RepID=A0A917F6R5_9HYPH|nr:hypothetical protein GCM10007301_09030 [Azorhizobium oxalatiphilum]